jgi:hypothetical protein
MSIAPADGTTYPVKCGNPKCGAIYKYVYHENGTREALLDDLYGGCPFCRCKTVVKAPYHASASIFPPQSPIMRLGRFVKNIFH